MLVAHSGRMLCGTTSSLKSPNSHVVVLSDALLFGGHASHGTAFCAGLLVVHLQGGRTALMAASEWGRLDVARLLLDRGAKVDTTNASEVGPVQYTRPFARALMGETVGWALWQLAWHYGQRLL
jgi:hypothetical protein